LLYLLIACASRDPWKARVGPRPPQLGLTTVVQNKGTIAAALRDRVAEILDDPNPDAAGLAAAKDALYQSMLVTLGTAYTTDAIVQFPVTVQCPYGPT
jgi:hypothetical protein